MKPTELIDRQIQAYNHRDIAVFLSCFANDIQLYVDDSKMAKTVGKNELGKYYQEIFDRSPELNVELISREIISNRIVDVERVYGMRGSETPVNATVEYEVSERLISTVRIIRQP